MCTDCNAQPNLSRRGFFGRARRRVAAPALPEPVEIAPGLLIYPREAWAGSDRPPINELHPESVYFLIVHHSATGNEYAESEAVTQIQDMYDNDTAAPKRWTDVTYNFFVDRFGRVFEGRSGSLKGPVRNDAVGGSQGWAQSVCLLGDFTSEPPSAEALDSLTKVLAWLADRHKLEIGPDATATLESRGSDKIPEGEEFTVNTIAGHRDVSDTECPGDVFYPYVKDELPTAVADYRAAPTTATTGPPTATTIQQTVTTPPGGTVPYPTAPGRTAPDQLPTVPSATSAASTPASGPASTGTDAPTSQPVTVGSAGSSAVGPLLSGVGSGVGVVAVATGIGWVIARRRSNGV